MFICWVLFLCVSNLCSVPCIVVRSACEHVYPYATVRVWLLDQCMRCMKVVRFVDRFNVGNKLVMLWQCDQNSSFTWCSCLLILFMTPLLFCFAADRRARHMPSSSRPRTTVSCSFRTGMSSPSHPLCIATPISIRSFSMEGIRMLTRTPSKVRRHHHHHAPDRVRVDVLPDRWWLILMPRTAVWFVASCGIAFECAVLVFVYDCV